MDKLKEFQNLISSISINSSYVICVLCVIIVSILEVVVIKVFKINFNPNKRKMEKAKEFNHIIKAKRISYYDDDITGTQVDSWYHAKYEYDVNGKKQVYKYLSRKNPPLQLDLYYVNNPRRPFHYEEKTSGLIILAYLLPFILTAIILKLLAIEL